MLGDSQSTTVSLAALAGWGEGLKSVFHFLP